jgi:hypothetical protein
LAHCGSWGITKETKQTNQSFKELLKTLSEVNKRNFKKTTKLNSNPSYGCKNIDSELCQETLRSINLNHERGWLPLFSKRKS